MKYLFGPVNSRRLGLSLGIDLIPANVCNFDCLYCEVGRTATHSCVRREYTPTTEIITEIDAYLAKVAPESFDVVTITATGEPTLHTGIGKIIRHLKNKCTKPVVVLTNGSLLWLPEVRRDLINADIVAPSLDGATPEALRRLNRPSADSPDIQTIITGLIDFKKEFHGQFWLEILLTRGINDAAEEIAALSQAVSRINPDKVQLNTVVRPPASPLAAPVDKSTLEKIASQFDRPVEIVADPPARLSAFFQPFSQDEVLEMLARRPCTQDDICQALNYDPATIGEAMEMLEKAKLITRTKHHDKRYYQIAG